MHTIYVWFNAGDINAIIALQPALKFNGGGHINHSIFWTNLTPNSTGGPTGLEDILCSQVQYVC